jgi:hypothetical protein
MLVPASVTVASTDGSGIRCTVIETNHIGIPPQSDTKLSNACTTIGFFIHIMGDRLNFFVMNISCYWIPVYHRDWGKSTLKRGNFLILDIRLM